MKLLNERDGLALGICNGFQALIKLGLVPYGEIRPQTDDSPTLTMNSIGRHQSKMVYTIGSPLKQYTLGTANAIALRFLDFYQPVADRMARTLIERGFDPERIVKIYNGMDFDRPEGEFDRVAYLRDTYGAEIEDGDVLCGIAARLTAVKDIATTIRGFAAALKSAPQLRLFIAGDGEDEDMLKKLCDQLGVRERVTFCGWILFLSKSPVLCLTSCFLHSFPIL